MPDKEAIKPKLVMKVNMAAAKRSKASPDTKTKMRPGSVPSGRYVYGKKFSSLSMLMRYPQHSLCASLGQAGQARKLMGVQ
jgi:hypothetical protein